MLLGFGCDGGRKGRELSVGDRAPAYKALEELGVLAADEVQVEKEQLRLAEEKTIQEKEKVKNNKGQHTQLQRKQKKTKVEKVKNNMKGEQTTPKTKQTKAFSKRERTLTVQIFEMSLLWQASTICEERAFCVWRMP